MEVQEVAEVIKVPKFMAFSRKNQAAKDALSEEKAHGEEEEGDEDEDDDDDVDSYSWFGASKPSHRRKLASGNAKPARGFDADSGAVYIQKLYRARLAKKAIRKALCKTWCKKADTTPVSSMLGSCCPGVRSLLGLGILSIWPATDYRLVYSCFALARVSIAVWAFTDFRASSTTRTCTRVKQDGSHLASCSDSFRDCAGR